MKERQRSGGERELSPMRFDNKTWNKLNKIGWPIKLTIVVRWIQYYKRDSMM